MQGAEELHRYRLYAEIGLGNPSLRSTEVEWADGLEVRVPGFHVGPKNRRPYLRVWIGRTVLIIDAAGMWVGHKRRATIKILAGVESSF